jgi:perosamine synthetase
MYGIVLDSSTGIDAVELARRLATRGVETRPFFLGLHEQPVFGDCAWTRSESFPVAERLARLGLYLPSGGGLSDDQIDRVIQAVRDSIP